MHTAEIEDECNLYRTENIISRESCPLQWWRDNRSKYSTIAKIAQRYLAGTATQAPRERVFRRLGDVSTTFRAKLFASHIEELAFSRENMKFAD